MVKENVMIKDLVEKSVPGFVDASGNLVPDNSGKFFNVQDLEVENDYDEVNEGPDLEDDGIEIE